MPKDFYFSSGAGALETHIEMKADGSFVGRYHNWEMGEIGDNYPDGTIYSCSFTGQFCTPEQIDEYRYVTKLEFLEIEGTPGNEYYEDNMRYVYSEPYGFEDADEFFIYLPGCPLNDVSEGFLFWAFFHTQMQETLPLEYYGLYNVGGEAGFVGVADVITLAVKYHNILLAQVSVCCDN